MKRLFTLLLTLTALPLMAQDYGISPRKTASILDTFSCIFQGILPYGAQMLMAASLSGINAIEIMGYLYYPIVVGVCAVCAITFRLPRKYS